MLNEDSVNQFIDGHRRWMAEAFQACGHHVSHFNKNTNKCVSCPEQTDEEILKQVYMPKGSLGYYGFNGGGPATAAQKSRVRALLVQHAGHPVAEAIRRSLNAQTAEGRRIERCDILPVQSWFKATFH
jgi:hypothetical protein